ncbi:MAG: hypothetical protein HZB20_07375, partial [Chloroflexi bacterium]|nr:hypothetical protein [Chloroflexota bacterium]
MAEAARFPFAQMDSLLGEASSLPALPIALTYGNRSVNVMPYDIGL